MMKNPDKQFRIPVFMIAANDIVGPMVVAMASILANTRSFVQFVILEKSTLFISDENKERILKLKNHFPNFSVEYIDVNPDDFADLAPTTAGYIPNDTYFRYIIPEVRPDIDKAIYLDVDVIVKKDIKDLFSESLEGNMLGAVNHPEVRWKDSYFNKVVSNLNLGNSHQYFNGGVLVFDCKKCRRKKITSKLFNLTRKLKDKIIWADQDIFNLVFEDSVKLLSSKYNALRSVYESEKIEDHHVIDDLYIIHFNGQEKPWNNTPYLAEYFWQYAKFTEFYVDLLELRVQSLGALQKVHERHIRFILSQVRKYNELLEKKKFLVSENGNVDADNSVFRIKLFKVLEILKIVSTPNCRKYFLFGLFPLWEKRRHGKSIQFILGGFFPLWKVLHKGNFVKYKLLNFLTLCSVSFKKLLLFPPYNKVDMSSKVKLVFLYHSPAFWPSWKSFYEACMKDDRIDAKIVFCPVRKQGPGWNGQFDNSEQWLKDNSFDYIHIDKLTYIPDIVVMQTPYDLYHRERKYWTEAYRKKGVRCIYISYGLEFVETPLAITNHFRLPIFLHAWKLYKFSKDLVKDYAKFCSAGNKHVVCVGHPKFDALYNAQKCFMPQWLHDKVNGRKIICWHTHFPCNYSLQNGKEVLSTFAWSENVKILEYIKSDTSHFYIFMPHHSFWGQWEKKFGVSAEELDYFRSQLQEGENSIIWEGEYPEVLAWSDAFWGERSAVTMEMITTGKPVCYLEQHKEVYNKFGNSVVNAYYYADNFDKVVEFLSMLERGDDPKAELRQKIFDKYFAPYWDGKCGERIKNDILVSLKREC